MRPILLGMLLCALPAASQAAVVGEEVVYRLGDDRFQGYVAYDDGLPGRRPGVLVVHEWWGHNGYARRRAEMLAQLGYTALAVDMYGEGRQAEHPADAKKFSAAVKANMEMAAARFQAGVERLRAHPTVDSGRLSAIGYCFGGGIVLEMARRGAELDAVASFHGSLTTTSPATPGVVRAQVLVFNGAADPMVKPEHVDAFRAEMEAAGVRYSLTDYPGARHAFTNPEADALGERFSMPIAYHAEADQASWAALVEALAGIYPR
ncbi:MAG: dienelactone hydrolase family protein [Candidatus Sedimenticola endophacoides]